LRRPETHVDRLLKGAVPGDLHVMTPTKFKLVLNLKTARPPASMGIEATWLHLLADVAAKPVEALTGTPGAFGSCR
jgi:hypothetical protein